MVSFSALSQKTARARLQAKTISNIEDLLGLINLKRFYTEIADVLHPGSWTERFLTSVNEWANDNDRALTTAQASKLLRVIQSCRDPLVAMKVVDGDTIDRLIRHPIYRQPLVQSTVVPRQARVDGDLLVLRGKFPPELSAALKGLNVARESVAQWDWINRLWVVRVDPSQVNQLIGIVGQYQFQHGDDVVELLAGAAERASEPPVFWLDGDMIRIDRGHCGDILHWLPDQPASPAAARRFVRIAGLFADAIVDPEVTRLAERTCVDHGPFWQPPIRQFMQDVFDLECRAIVSLPVHWQDRDCSYWLDPLASVLKQSQVDHVVITNAFSKRASSAASSAFVQDGITVTTAETYDFLKDEVTPPRSAVLLHMAAGGVSPLSSIKDHYPRTIVITDTISGLRENLAGSMPTQQEVIADRHLMGRLRERPMRELGMLFRATDALSRYLPDREASR